MARPCKTGMDYFPHDVDAAGDEKIEALRALYGNDGYAFFFILLERIYRTSTGELDISNTAKKAAVINKIGVSPDKFHAMLKDAFDIELFDERVFEGKHCITSNGIKKRVIEVEKLREKWRRKKGVFSGENEEDNVLENTQETGERKEKKSKENKTTINNDNKLLFKEYVRLTQEQYYKLIADNGGTVIEDYIDRLNNYLGSTGKHYKSHYHTILNWIRKDKVGCKASGNGGNSKKPTFNNFTNRTYDAKSLEESWLKQSRSGDYPTDEEIEEIQRKKREQNNMR